MTVKGRGLIKRTVISLDEATDIGSVENIVFDQDARMAALIIKRRGHQKADLASTTITNVHALGRDAITLEKGEQVEEGERIGELEGHPNLRQLIGCRVLTEGGMYLGIVRDLLLDPEERRITDFQLAGRGVWGRLRGDIIPATGRLRFGKELVIVPNAIPLKGRATLREITRLEPGESAVGLVATVPLELPVRQAETMPAGEALSRSEEGLTRAVGGN